MRLRQVFASFAHFLILFIIFGCCINCVTSKACSNITSSTECTTQVACKWQNATSPAKCVCASDIKQDIIFLLDSSWSLTRNDFTTQKAFVRQILENGLPKGARVGAISFASTAVVNLTLKWSEGRSIAEVASAVDSIPYTGGVTETQRGITATLGEFQRESTSDKAKLIVLVTDGNPTDRPCDEASKIKSAGVKVVVIGVGQYWTQSEIKCLVQNEVKDIIPVGGFTAAAFQKVRDRTEEVVCASAIDLKITEIQPVGNNKWVELFNPGGPVRLQGFDCEGMFYGKSDATATDILGQFQYLVIYQVGNGSFVPDCSHCGCLKKTNSSKACKNAMYMACGSGNCKINNTITWTLTNWFFTLKDTKSNVIDSLYYTKVSNWPTISTGYHYSLQNRFFNNKEGANWKQPCETSGTPGDHAKSNCTASCTIPRCKLNGATDPTCTNGKCVCRSTSHYASGLDCLRVPKPGSCVMKVLKNGTETKYKYEWKAAPLDIFHKYEVQFDLKSGSPKSSIVISPFVWEDEVKWNTTAKLAGTVRTRMGITEPFAYSERVLCHVKTSSPTPSPTHSPTSPPTKAPTFQKIKVGQFTGVIQGGSKTIILSWLSPNVNPPTTPYLSNITYLIRYPTNSAGVTVSGLTHTLTYSASATDVITIACVWLNAKGQVENGPTVNCILSTFIPTKVPTNIPTISPSNLPTKNPTKRPTFQITGLKCQNVIFTYGGGGIGHVITWSAPTFNYPITPKFTDIQYKIEWPVLSNGSVTHDNHLRAYTATSYTLLTKLELNIIKTYFVKIKIVWTVNGGGSGAYINCPSADCTIRTLAPTAQPTRAPTVKPPSKSPTKHPTYDSSLKPGNVKLSVLSTTTRIQWDHPTFNPPLTPRKNDIKYKITWPGDSTGSSRPNTDNEYTITSKLPKLDQNNTVKIQITWDNGKSGGAIIQCPSIQCTTTTRKPSKAPTSIPSRSPTNKPTWETPMVWVDHKFLCPQEKVKIRCSCNTLTQRSCTGDLQQKQFQESTSLQSISIRRYPPNYPFPITIQWNFTGVGGNATRADIIPFSGIHTIAGATSQASHEVTLIDVKFILENPNQGDSDTEIFNFSLSSYKSELSSTVFLAVYPTAFRTVLKDKESAGGGLVVGGASSGGLPLWLWPLIVALLLLLCCLGIILYRCWVNQIG